VSFLVINQYCKKVVKIVLIIITLAANVMTFN